MGYVWRGGGVTCNPTMIKPQLYEKTAADYGTKTVVRNSDRIRKLQYSASHNRRFHEKICAGKRNTSEMRSSKMMTYYHRN